jgi:RNA polymerase subunit RPABC4/transcription elongation factor Spt4
LYCKHCGTELEDSGNFCPECGKTHETVKVIERVVVEKEPEKKSVGASWFIIGILMPIIGVVAGLIFTAQGRKNAVALLLVSIVVWGLFALLLLSG